jgi:hypothetical protein
MTMTIGSVSKYQKAAQANAKESLKDKFTEELASNNAGRTAKQPEDRLELSAEAQKLQPIRSKIEEGFYDKPEVIRAAAKKISAQLSSHQEG